MGWRLFLDDFRVPQLVRVDPKAVVVCRTARKALEEVAARGFPDVMYLDFDLGFADDGLSGLDFLRQLYASWDPATKIPDFEIISDHPDRHSMSQFMEQWSKGSLPPKEQDMERWKQNASNSRSSMPSAS